MSENDDLRSIAGRVALVTGAASGMGRATAELFSAQGAKVAATDIRRNGPVEHVADLVDPVAIEALVEEVRTAYGPVDILVNCAGIAAGGELTDPAYEDTWAGAFAVNLDAPMRLIRACIPDLVRDGAGRIVNVASTEGLQATPRTSPYTASKHGVVGLTRAVAVELGHTGVTCNAVCPGPIRTPMTDRIPEDAKQRFSRRRVPARRYGEPHEVAHMILSLVLPAASYVNGAVLPVDGGLGAKGN